MEQKQPISSVSSDVLHFANQTKLTPEEIAKAVAHHKRHHPDSPQKGMQAGGKKQPGMKAK
jgi:hypothetical protein